MGIAGIGVVSEANLPGPVYDWFAAGFDPQDLEDVKAALDDLGRQ
jgi:hypothetical protein